MVRIIIIALTLLCIGATPAYSQILGGTGARDRGEPIFTPLKSIRDRAANGVVSDKLQSLGDSCSCNGKLCPEAACKRCQRKKANEEAQAREDRAEAAQLKQLEAEAKKTELEAQLLAEEEQKRNKPWDVADEENAELGDLLALAAEAKKAQDLAPKKQQALDYLASLGCSKDPRVIKAVMAGLKDYNVEVRRTAVQTVIYAVQGPAGLVYPQQNSGYGYVSYGQGGSCASGNCNICVPNTEPSDPDCPICDVAKQKKEAKAARKKQRRERLCSCGKKDCCECDSTAACQVCEQPCEPCQACIGADGCKSCCDAKIREELRMMAFEMDPKNPNCYYEPSIEVRNLALQAYNLCPEKAKKDDPVLKPLEGQEEGKGNSEAEGVSEGKGASSDGDESVEPTLDGPTPDSDDGLDDADPPADTGQSNDPEASDDIDNATSRSKMLRGRIIQFNPHGYLIRHSNEYHIPEGNLLYISTNANDGHVVEVVSSDAGMAKVKLIEGRFSGRSSDVNIGVMR